MVSRSGSAVEESRPMITVPPKGTGIAFPLSWPFSTTSSGIESSSVRQLLLKGIARERLHVTSSPPYLRKLPYLTGRNGQKQLYQNSVENRGAHANMGSALLDRDLEILGHPHGELLQSRPDGQVAKAPKMGTRIRPLGRHRHETDDLQRLPRLHDGRFGAVDRIPSLRGLPADVDLYEDGDLFVVLRELADQRRPVDGMDRVGPLKR